MRGWPAATPRRSACGLRAGWPAGEQAEVEKSSAMLWSWRVGRGAGQPRCTRHAAPALAMHCAPEMAQGTAATGCAGKCEAASTAPRALFCMPTCARAEARGSRGACEQSCGPRCLAHLPIPSAASPAHSRSQGPLCGALLSPPTSCHLPCCPPRSSWCGRRAPGCPAPGSPRSQRKSRLGWVAGRGGGGGSMCAMREAPGRGRWQRGEEKENGEGARNRRSRLQG